MAFITFKVFVVLGLLVGCCMHQTLGFSAAPPLLGSRVSGAQHAPRVMIAPVTLRSDHAARGRSVLLRAAGADKEAEMKKLEKEAEEVIEEAERLWKEALEARDNADQLCTIAEELAADTETKSASAAEKIADMEKFSLKSIAQSQQAVNMSFNTMNALNAAQDELERAAALEEAAEVALARSEDLMAKLEALEEN